MAHFGKQRLEKDVGITLRLGNHQRFTAVLKERFSDFHVNEIDPGGNIVKLTNLDPPADNRDQIVLDNPEICALIPDETRSAVVALQEKLAGGITRELKKISVNIDVTKLDKAERTKIHKWIGSFDKLSSETVDKSIKVVPMTNNHRTSRRPANRGKFTHCVLYKEGVETSSAIGFISKKLNLKPGLVSYAGIKDKRAKTAQRISLSNIEASRLIGIFKYSKNMTVGNFSYHERPISLGDLKGNHFKLLLKDLKGEKCDKEETEKAVSTLKTKGFINYYGMQRFGTYEVSTWQVGKKILLQEWMEAFDLILGVKPNDHPSMVRAKELWLKDRDASKAIKELPRQRTTESHLLHGLAKFYPNKDFVNTFTRMPRAVRLLYLHAYQSYLWNQVASFRIEEYGLEPAVGDLVYEDPEADFVDSVPDDEVDLNELGDATTPQMEPKMAQKPAVKHLTDDDISSGKYTIYDIVIPQFGSDVKMPLNKTKECLEKLVRDEGMDSDVFVRFRPVSDKPVGAYRKLIVLPKNVSSQFKLYSEQDPVDTFIPSDWDLLQKTQEPELGLDKSSNNQSTDTETPAIEIVRDKKCLILEFSLPSSSYATMALREILTEDSSSFYASNKVIDKSDSGSGEPEVKRAKTELNV